MRLINEMTDKEFLLWLHDHLQNQYEVHPTKAFMLKLKTLSERLPPGPSTTSEPKPQPSQSPSQTTSMSSEVVGDILLGLHNLSKRWGVSYNLSLSEGTEPSSFTSKATRALSVIMELGQLPICQGVVDSQGRLWACQSSPSKI